MVSVDEENDKRLDSFIIDDIHKETISGWGHRHYQCLILFFTLTTAYSLRACMGVALVDMTVPEDLNITANLTENITISNYASNYTAIDESNEGHGFLHALMLTPPYPKFRWSKKIQDTIIASFFWGYMLLQIPSGHLAHKFGARRLLIGSMAVNAVVSFILPWAAYYGGWVFLVICRVLQGLSQACIMPSMHTFFGKWAPIHERGRLTSVTYGGQALGPVLGLPLTGFIASTSMGWPGIFRFYGALAAVMVVVLAWAVKDSPAQHPSISEAEKRYIEEAMGQSGDDKSKHMSVPWAKILRHPGLYAIVVAHMGNTWGQLTLYSEVPSYMQNVMGVNIKENGLLSALPFLFMWVFNFFFCWITDKIIERKLLSVTHTRKLANTVGFIPACLGLIALAYAPKNMYVVETLLIIICSFKICSHAGFLVNHIDISPNFAGTMMSVSNFASNLFGSLAPITAGFILTDVKSDYLWRQVFFVSAGIYFFTNIIYVVLGTAEKAEWNESDIKTEDIEDQNEVKPMLSK